MTDERSTSLIRLYKRIKNCHQCPNMDQEKSLRLIEAVDIPCDVFILSQSLAESQLRRSGVNFFNEKGTLGNTGRNLEKFLNRFNRTVYPPKEIRLLNGSIIPKRKTGYYSVYNTEIAQCYPGKKTKGDRVPNSIELSNCINQKFLLDEISLIRPKLLLLMGRLSRDTFYRNILRERTIQPFSEEVSKGHAIERILPNEYRIKILPIQHASGANPNFGRMLSSGLPHYILSIL